MISIYIDEREKQPLGLIYPELLMLKLLAEKLTDNEYLVISGCESFNSHRGYGDGFKWTAHHAIIAAASSGRCALSHAYRS